MHKVAVVRSVYHNGPCHNNQPMYTGRDDGLQDEDAQRGRHGERGIGAAWHDESAGRRSRRATLCLHSLR